jgi:hypothetical protein
MPFALMLLLAGCVSHKASWQRRQKYDALQTRYDELNQTMSAQVASNQMHIERLQKRHQSHAK